MEKDNIKPQKGGGRLLTYWSSGHVYLKCLLRCYLGGACFNHRGYLNVGLVYAMYPGLAEIHKDPGEFKAAVKRYVRHFHTHPFWLPCLVGIFLSAEKMIAAKHFPPAMLDKIKNTTSYTLSALGDSVFAGSLLIFWALSTVCLLLSGFRVLPLVIGVLLFVGLQVFRIYTFWGGLRIGFGFLERLKRWDLMNCGTILKYLNAILVLWLWYLIWPKPLQWIEWSIGMVGMAVLARFTMLHSVPRLVVVGAILVTITVLPAAAQWVEATIAG